MLKYCGIIVKHDGTGKTSIVESEKFGKSSFPGTCICNYQQYVFIVTVKTRGQDCSLNHGILVVPLAFSASHSQLLS